MKILVVGNQKGGVGKTTLSIHLAFHAAEMGWRVLAVDLDEGDLKEGMAPDAELWARTLRATSLFQLRELTGEPVAVAANLGLIPADVGLLDIDDQPIEVVMTLRDQLAQLRPDFDLCVIDTPPNLQRRMIAALVAADALISPIGIDAFSLARMPLLVNTINTVRENYNSRLRMLGFVANRVDPRSRQDVATFPEFRAHFGNQILDVYLTEQAVLRSAAAAGVSVWSHARTGSARAAQKEMRAVCEAIFTRLKGESCG